MKAKLYKTDKGEYILLHPNKSIYENGSVIGYSRDIEDKTLQFENSHKLSKQNCDELFGVVDVDNLAEENTEEFIEVFDYNDGRGNICRFNNSHQAQESYIKGFNKAMELNKDKLFTIEDIELAMVCMIGQEIYYGKTYEETRQMRHDYIKSYISYLTKQPNEMEVEIEMEWNPFSNYCDLCGEGGKYMETPCDHNDGSCLHWRPKLDSNGCIILKK
jgi:hypothetical protein